MFLLWHSRLQVASNIRGFYLFQQTIPRLNRSCWACFQSPDKTLLFFWTHTGLLLSAIFLRRWISAFSHSRILKFQYIHENVLKHEAEHRNMLMFQSFWCLNLKDMTTKHLCYLVFALSKLRFTQKEWNVLDEAQPRTYIKLLWNVCDLMNFTLLWNVKEQPSDRTQNTTMFFSLFFQWNKEKFIPRT